MKTKRKAHNTRRSDEDEDEDEDGGMKMKMSSSLDKDSLLRIHFYVTYSSNYPGKGRASITVVKLVSNSYEPVKVKQKTIQFPTFRSSHSFPVRSSSPNSFHSTNEFSRIICKSRSANCSRIAPAPVDISRLRNVSKPGVVKKSGMLYFQDWISYSNEPRNRKKVGFLVIGLAKEKLG